MDPTLTAQIAPYQPWLILGGIPMLLLCLRVARQGLRQRVDAIGYRLRGERGPLIWFWLNAPGVMIHELSHALVLLLFRPFGFRITSITLFRIQSAPQAGSRGRAVKSGRKQSLQLGEVQYVRPPKRLMSHIGDGLSAIAPLFGGIGMFALLYWTATGYNVWDVHLQLLRPGWPWWTLLFAPYLILTVTSELWPSHQDWHGGRWFVLGTLAVLTILIVLLWYTRTLVFDNALLQAAATVAFHIDFALLALLILDMIFLLVAEALVRIVNR